LVQSQSSAAAGHSRRAAALCGVSRPRLLRTRHSHFHHHCHMAGLLPPQGMRIVHSGGAGPAALRRQGCMAARALCSRTRGTRSIATAHDRHLHCLAILLYDECVCVGWCVFTAGRVPCELLLLAGVGCSSLVRGAQAAPTAAAGIWRLGAAAAMRCLCRAFLFALCGLCVWAAAPASRRLMYHV
jgi:hypothetical protein